MSFIGKSLCSVCRTLQPALYRVTNISSRVITATKDIPQSVSVMPQLFTNISHPYSSKHTSEHRKDAVVKGEGEDMYEPQSPYRTHWPRHYGYNKGQIYTGGLLPRVRSQIQTLPTHKVKHRWTEKKALFGQNDYIDILGDGNVHPVDLIQGPSWIRGFNGNELQRLIRRMKMQGARMRHLHPSLYKSIWKRIRFLYKKHNRKRGSRVR